MGARLDVGHDEAGGLEGGDRVGLGQLAHGGHRDAGGTGREDEVDGAAGGHLGVGCGLLGEDLTCWSGVHHIGDVPHEERDGLKGGARI